MDLILFTNTPPQTKAHEREEAHERGLKFAKGLDHHPTNDSETETDDFDFVKSALGTVEGGCRLACGSNCRGWIIIRRMIQRLRQMISISSSLHLGWWREVVGYGVVDDAD
ncbi:hypothetical protein LINPERHAP1_LOCUS27546 [Linum perenne]